MRLCCVFYSVSWTKCFYIIYGVFLPYEPVAEKKGPCCSFHSVESSYTYMYLYKYRRVISLCVQKWVVTVPLPAPQ